MKKTIPLLSMLFVSAFLLSSCEQLPPPNTLSIDQGESVNLEVGDTLQLTMTFDPIISDHACDFSSSVGEYASVSETGLIEALAPGDTIIRVASHAAPEEVYDEIIVHVADEVIVDVPPTSVAITEGDSDTLRIGQTLQLSLAFMPATNVIQTVTFSSSSPAVASVSATGLITAVSAGDATITVQSTVAPSVTDTIDIHVENTVLDAPMSVVIQQGETASIQEGDTLQLRVNINPHTADPAVTWTSNNHDVATVSSNGLVTAHAPGNVLITVTSVANSSAVDVIAIEVTEAPPVIITPTSIGHDAGVEKSIRVGEDFFVTHNVYPQGAPNAVTWLSSNPNIVSVDGGYVLGKAEGNVTITITALNHPSVTTSFMVQVEAAVLAWPSYVQEVLDNLYYYDLPSAPFIMAVNSNIPVYDFYKIVSIGNDQDNNTVDLDFYVTLKNATLVDYQAVLEDAGFETDVDGDYLLAEKTYMNLTHEISIMGYENPEHNDDYELMVNYVMTGSKSWPLDQIAEIMSEDIAILVPAYVPTSNPDDVWTTDFVLHDLSTPERKEVVIEVYNGNEVDYNYYLNTDLTRTGEYEEEFFTRSFAYVGGETEDDHYVTPRRYESHELEYSTITITGEVLEVTTYDAFPQAEVQALFAHDASVDMSHLPDENYIGWADEYAIEVIKATSDGKRTIRVYGKSEFDPEENMFSVILGLKDTDYADTAEGTGDDYIYRRVRGEGFYNDHYLSLVVGNKDNGNRHYGFYLDISSHIYG